MQLLLGRPVADAILGQLEADIKRTGVHPGIAVLLVGDDPASHLYVSMKERAAARAGIRFVKEVMADTVPEVDILARIGRWNKQADIHGILVQVPLPEGFDTEKIIAAIDPGKDVDGFHPRTVERFVAGERDLCPVFPLAMAELLRSTEVPCQGKRAVALVNSAYFGKVMQAMMENERLVPRVVMADDFQNEKETISDADIIFSACGIPSLIRGHQVKDGVVIIDGGIAKQDGKIVGDVNRESVETKAAFLSPVPGGVGPVTIACLLRRTLLLSKE
jgi:methylenetetrahydrofolate dehydrogenase (NADP+)/methenyltetrahydrofolate cyclohydrolase